MLISGETNRNIVENVNFFNEFFVSQCPHLENNSEHR